MHKIMATALASTLMLSGAFASETSQALPPETNAEQTSLAERMGAGNPEPPLSYLKFHSVTDPGEVVGPGDEIVLRREFLNWSLNCDVRPSKDIRACFTEQKLASGSTGIVWRIGQNTELKPVVQISLPADFKPEIGLRIKFSGLEKTIDRSHFVCTSRACLGGFLFEGFVQSAIMESEQIGFSFERKDGGIVNLQGSMQGLQLALDAARRDPFGRDVSYAVSKEKSAKDAGKKDTGGASKPKKPAAAKKTPVERKPESNASKPQVTEAEKLASDVAAPRKNTLY